LKTNPEDFYSSLDVVFEEVGLVFEDTESRVVSGIPTLPPASASVESLDFRGGGGITYSMTAFFGLAPWAALLASLLGLGLDSGCGRSGRPRVRRS